MKKDTGAKIEVLALNPIKNTPNLWNVLIKPLKRVKVSDRLQISENKYCEIVEIDSINNKHIINFFSENVIEDVLNKYGTMPLPPYIKATDENKKELSDNYQSIFGDIEGSVAAPTASLHFTPEILHKLNENGIKIVYITLHIGLGTFLPVKTEKIAEHKIHTEFCEIPKETAELINHAKENNQSIIAVGTSVIRTLESFYNETNKQLDHGKKNTDLFIYPGFRFNVVTKLITNFHLPKSTLLMLVYAFGGINLLQKAYKIAVSKRYLFYSFGDAMIIDNS